MLAELQCFQRSVVLGRASVCDAVMGDVCERGRTSVSNASQVMNMKGAGLLYMMLS